MSVRWANKLLLLRLFLFWIADVYEMEDDRTWKEKLLDKIYDLMFGWDCSPGWYRFAHYVEQFIMDPFVDLFITLCIVSNTGFMACDHADISPYFANVLNIGNIVRHCHHHQY